MAATIDVTDVKTNEKLAFDNVNLDAGLVDVKKNPKVSDETASSDDKGEKKK